MLRFREIKASFEKKVREESRRSKNQRNIFMGLMYIY